MGIPGCQAEELDKALGEADSVDEIFDVYAEFQRFPHIHVQRKRTDLGSYVKASYQVALLRGWYNEGNSLVLDSWDDYLFPGDRDHIKSNDDQANARACEIAKELSLIPRALGASPFLSEGTCVVKGLTRFDSENVTFFYINGRGSTHLH